MQLTNPTAFASNLEDLTPPDYWQFSIEHLRQSDRVHQLTARAVIVGTARY